MISTFSGVFAIGHLLKLNWLTGTLLAVASAVTFWMLLRSMSRSSGSEEPLDA